VPVALALHAACLFVCSRSAAGVEAVITQAHRLFYLWSPAVTRVPSASGALTLTATGRPILFSESGGHGLYAFGRAPLKPKGGNRYPQGTAAVPAVRLRLLAPLSEGTGVPRQIPVELRALEELQRFTHSPDGPFRGLQRAKPPWLWDDRRGAVPRGSIVLDPAGFYEALLRTRPP
jgi:hypothetical protein